MANSIDFRADQIQTSKIIVTGSTPQKTLLIYGIAADDTPANQGNIDPTVFDTGSIGSDVFLFVSGGIGARGGSDPWISAFGGDLHISGNLTVDGTIPGGPSFFTEISLNAIETTGSVAMTYLFASSGAEITGSLAQGAAGNVASGTNSHAEGDTTTASGYASHSEGQLTTASGNYSHTEGQNTTASGESSHAEGNNTTASSDASHAEGFGTTASGMNSHAEGLSSTASGAGSHAEGYSTTASGQTSHSEGFTTYAIGDYSHAEGWGSEAFGTGSLAAGLFTVASGAVDGISFPPTTTQAAFGKYNLRDNVDSLFVVGDGLDDSNRHDVFRVNSGSVQVTGSLEVLGGITGSIRYVEQTNTTPFLVAGSSINLNYNNLGQWEISSSIQKINVAGYNRTNLTSPTVIGLAYFNPTEYPLFSNLAFTAVGMNMAGVSGGLDLYDQNTSTLVAQLTWSGNSTLTTGSFQTTTISFPASAKSYELHFSQSGGANGGTDYSTVGFVNFVLS